MGPGLRESDGPVSPRRKRRETNEWGLLFCFNVFDQIDPEEFRLGRARWSLDGSYTVTRRMPKNRGFTDEADITMHVTTQQWKMCYIAYTADTGTTLFMVTKIRQPKKIDNGKEDWSNTLRGYQLFTTEQALARVDVKEDTMHFMCVQSLGKCSLELELEEDTGKGLITYHPTDWEVPMDVRCIVGVVRRAQSGKRDKYVREDEHATCPAKSDLIFSGLPFSASQ